MKKIILAVGMVLLGGTFLFGASNTQPVAAGSDNLITVFSNVGIPKDYSMENIQIKTIDSFSNADDWLVNMPREQGLVLRKKILIKDNEFCLGIKCKPYLRGYNWIEIRPPHPLSIPGTSKAISLNVNGRNLRHNLIAWVQDYLGVEYRIVMGSMDFEGWQLVASRIPAYVKQYSRYIPSYRPLKLTKFVIEFDPDEYPEAYYIYVKNFEAAVDTYQTMKADELVDQDGHEKFDTYNSYTTTTSGSNK